MAPDEVVMANEYDSMMYSKAMQEKINEEALKAPPLIPPGMYPPDYKIKYPETRAAAITTATINSNHHPGAPWLHTTVPTVSQFAQDR